MITGPSAVPRVLVPLGLLAGTAVQLQQSALWVSREYWGLLISAFVVLGSAVAVARVPGLRYGSFRTCVRYVFLIFGTCAIAFALTGLRSGGRLGNRIAADLEGRDIDVVAVVKVMPQRTPTGIRMRLAVETAVDRSERVELPAVIEVAWYGGDVSAASHYRELNRQPSPIRAGERLSLRVRLKAPRGHMNPGAFDYELWLWEQGVGATGYVRATASDPPPQSFGLVQRWNPLLAIERARQSTREAIFQRVHDTRAAGVLAALVVGDQRAIERSDWDVFRATGVAHLMSISGLHVTMFAWMAAAFCGWLWRWSARYTLALCDWLPAPHAAVIGGVALAALYALFSGWGVPAQRTVWMLTVVGLLRLSGARWPWGMVWLAAAVTVVLADPWAMLQAGFWLSFVAVGVLLAGHSPLSFTSKSVAQEYDKSAVDSENDLKNASDSRLQRLRRQFAGKFTGTASSLLREQALISLALAPLSLVLFGQVSIVGLVANLVAIPVVTWLVTPLAMLGALIPVAWDMAALLMQGLQSALAFGAKLPGAVWQGAQPPLVLGVLACVGGVWLALPGPWVQRALGLPWIVIAVLWEAPRPPQGQFEVLALDVGQGSAVVVRTAGRTLLVDAGPAYSQDSDAGQRVVLPYLRSLNEALDALMLTHRDTDHIGGAQALLAAYPTATIFSSLPTEHALRAAPAVEKRHKTCVAGQTWVWDGVQFEVLHPQAADYQQQLKSNAMSCVLRVSNGQHTALLTGDIEAAQEAALVATVPQRLKADLLLVPHHGSATSSTPGFLQAVSPRFAVAQAGYRNRFGHPVAGVRANYAAQQVPLFTSPACGAATWRSVLPEITCYRKTAKRYWHAGEE